MSERRKNDFTLDQLRDIQREFELGSWDGPTDLRGKTDHFVFHLGKLLGKISTVSERWDHNLEPDLEQLKNEVIPDLLYYALGLADLHGVDLTSAYLKRLDANKKRVADWVGKREKK